jgi:hypothetical protein
MQDELLPDRHGVHGAPGNQLHPVHDEADVLECLQNHQDLLRTDSTKAANKSG